MPSFQARIDQALNTICKAVNIVHTTSLILIAVTTLLLSSFFFFVYPPLILLILFFSFLTVLYVNHKKDFIAQFIDDVDEQSAVEDFNYRQTKRQRRRQQQSPHQQNQQHQSRLLHLNLARRLVLSVVDSSLGVARDYILLVPLTTTFISIVAFVFKYHALAVIALAVTIVLMGILCCCCHIVKFVAHGLVDNFFKHDPQQNGRAQTQRVTGEKTPLLRATV